MLGRVKEDLVGGLVDLRGMKGGLEVERLVLGLRLGAVVVVAVVLLIVEGRVDEIRGAGLRGTDLVDAGVLEVDVSLVAGVRCLVDSLAEDVDPEITSFGFGFAVAVRGVLVLTGESRVSGMALGNSSATCSIASSRASKASTESSMRATYLDGDRLMISSTKESGPSPVSCPVITIRAGVLVLIDPTNESPSPCVADWLVDGAPICTAGSNLGVFNAEPCTAANFLSGLMIKALLAFIAAALGGVLGLEASIGTWNVSGTGTSFLNSSAAMSAAELASLWLSSSRTSCSLFSAKFSSLTRVSLRWSFLPLFDPLTFLVVSRCSVCSPSRR